MFYSSLFCGVALPRFDGVPIAVRGDALRGRWGRRVSSSGPRAHRVDGAGAPPTQGSPQHGRPCLDTLHQQELESIVERLERGNRAAEFLVVTPLFPHKGLIVPPLLRCIKARMVTSEAMLPLSVHQRHLQQHLVQVEAQLRRMRTLLQVSVKASQQVATRWPGEGWMTGSSRAALAAYRGVSAVAGYSSATVNVMETVNQVQQVMDRMKQGC
ncbi:hypothetical protein IscW_ISCW019004 [Ixodes scapularis]|uniref:Uncharacterized protein n=1 Tax=Ixodes scapularis TaxID=6945 RepID=B7PND5_IXOSC|nr:hypothetical protein IscW_ISCW019004 [Ixodes scapularis]|eukprot:XP_002435275.1 hypothetical protein IscW_ISCW019004 [Ixodes scapularis]